MGNAFHVRGMNRGEELECSMGNLEGTKIQSRTSHAPRGMCFLDGRSVYDSTPKLVGMLHRFGQWV